MATDIVIPNVGESVTSGIISAWTVADGEYVERDQTVLELETDKVTMEVPAPASGIIKHGASEGDEVDVGASVGSIDESADKPAGDSSGGGGDTPAAEAPKPQAEQPKTEPAPKPAASSAAAAVATAPAPSAAPASNADVKATPLARKLADDQGVDLKQISGTGAAGGSASRMCSPGSRPAEQHGRSTLDQLSLGPVAA
ncbi:MAG: biotin/lipoyl-containing protein [Phycisphaerales bacterium]